MRVQIESAAEHVDEGSFLWLQRRSAVRAPHYGPAQLSALDEQIEAVIDALRVEGGDGWVPALRAAASGFAEDCFVAGVLALDAIDERLGPLLDLAHESDDALPGLASALGWRRGDGAASALAALSQDARSFAQRLAMTGHDLHRRDPGGWLGECLASASRPLRMRALRTAGDVGRSDLLAAVIERLDDAAGLEGRFWAARSAALLGDRGCALDALEAIAVKASPRQRGALDAALQAGSLEAGHDLLMRLDGLPHAARLRTIGSGYIGDAKYVPWLIDQMSIPAIARIAGEAFVHITGADFNLDQLESMPPEGYDDGPTDDPDDDDVELPEDIALPWPDVARVKAWWMEHRSAFTPGRKLFLGKPITPEHCVHVLKTGYQRQRVIAAHYRSLIQPGSVLFPTSAPAWRQQKLLESM